MERCPYGIAGSDPVPQIPMGCPDLADAIARDMRAAETVPPVAGGTVSEMRWFVKLEHSWPKG